MLITVLAYNLIGSGGLSVGRNITALLPKIGPDHQYLILIPDGLGYEEHAGHENVRIMKIPLMNKFKRIKFDLFSLPKIVKSFETDVILALGNIGLSNNTCKQAILIHQPQIIYPSKHFGNVSINDRFRIWAVKRRVRECLQTTDIVFCQTPVARERFSQSMSYPVEKIRIMPNAVSEFSKNISVDSKVKGLLADSGKFNFFFLTRYMPHKNLEVIVELLTRHRDQLQDVRFLITIEKSQHPHAVKFLTAVRENGLEDYILNVGPLKQEDLGDYFINSDGFFFPTFLESFSGTYLEAMHFGLPILTSDLDFACYVCGDAALYFDPWNCDDILEKILFFKKNSDVRKELVSKGNKRISFFFKSWQDIVEEMLKEIESLV